MATGGPMEPLEADDPARIAGYAVVARLGSGGMGRVYLARSPGGRPVALKVIRPDLVGDPDFHERFVREIAAARSISGVFTAPVLDADPHGTPAWLATGYVAGMSVGEAVSRFGPLPEGAVTAVASGLAEALAAVHAAGLVHRDVKPSNIMLSADGPKLIDFGIARDTAAVEYTQTGVVIGSPVYLAPEQVNGTGLGPAADIFAMASVLAFALTGRAPFTADDRMAVLYQVVHGEPRLDGIQEPMLSLLRRCLDKDPTLRPTPAQLIDRLDASAADATTLSDHGVLPPALTAEIMRRSAELLSPAAPTSPPSRPAADPHPPPHPAGRYGLGIDLGTAQTAAAVWRDGLVFPVALGGRSQAVPSVLFLRDDGSVLVGDAASRRGIVETDRVVRAFKRRFGDDVPLLVGDQEITADELTGHLLRWVVDTVTEREGGPPAHVSLTHPATWGPHRRELLAATAEKAGLGRVGMLPEPVAAAAYYASTQRLSTGDLLAVYDLGGGTFDATIVRKTAGGFAIQGAPTGDDGLGGIDFDQSVMDHVTAALGADWPALDDDDTATLAALEQVREHVTAAKEALSSDVDATVPVILPGTSRQVRITRAEFEAAVEDRLRHTVDLLGEAINSAGITPSDITTVLLTGGSSRIPLISRLIATELGIPVAVDTHPKLATCLGAAIATGARLGPPPQTPAQPAGRGAEPSAVAVDLAATGILTRLDTTGSRRPPRPDGPRTGVTTPIAAGPAPAPAAAPPPAPAPAPAPPRHGRRRAWIIAMLSTLLGVAVAGGALALLLWPTPPAEVNPDLTGNRSPVAPAQPWTPPVETPPSTSPAPTATPAPPPAPAPRAARPQPRPQPVPAEPQEPDESEEPDHNGHGCDDPDKSHRPDDCEPHGCEEHHDSDGCTPSEHCDGSHDDREDCGNNGGNGGGNGGSGSGGTEEGGTGGGHTGEGGNGGGVDPLEGAGGVEGGSPGGTQD
jgi:actin-like ATPase involved in cell morphogenesis